MDWIPYLLAGIILLFVFLQTGLWLGTKRLEGKPAPAYPDDLAARVAGHDRILFYFFSAHCGPCQAMTPSIDEMSRERSNVVKIDIGEEHELACRFGVTVVPSILVVDQGRIAKALVGRQSKRRLLSLLG